MAHLKSPLMELLTVSSVVAILAVAALQPAKGYLEKSRKTAIEEEITNCIKELAYENVFSEVPKYECKISSNNEKLQLFYDKKNHLVYSNHKVFHFEFGRDIECVVSANRAICDFAEF